MGHPVLAYDSIGELAARLTSAGAKCFEINSSCGLSGFVFAASMEFRPRHSRVQVIGPESVSAFASAPEQLETEEKC